MKRIIFIATALLLALNIVAGLILSGYKPFNVIFSSIAIFITGALLYSLQLIHLKDAYAISLSCLFVVLGLIEYVLGAVSPDYFQDNWIVLILSILIGLEVLITVVCSVATKKV